MKRIGVGIGRNSEKLLNKRMDLLKQSISSVTGLSSVEEIFANIGVAIPSSSCSHASTARVLVLHNNSIDHSPEAACNMRPSVPTE
jgi:hypothetical protein